MVKVKWYARMITRRKWQVSNKVTLLNTMPEKEEAICTLYSCY